MSSFSKGEEVRLEAETEVSYESETNENNSPLARLRKYGGRMMVTTLLSTTLFLGACTDSNDCVPATPPAVTPGSSGFTAAKPSTNTGTYCRSRSTGGYYYSSGGYYSGGSSSS